MIVHAWRPARGRGSASGERLIPSHLFKIPIQAAIAESDARERCASKGHRQVVRGFITERRNYRKKRRWKARMRETGQSHPQRLSLRRSDGGGIAAITMPRLLKRGGRWRRPRNHRGPAQDVTAKCYGGESPKRSVEKQKAGKLGCGNMVRQHPSRGSSSRRAWGRSRPITVRYTAESVATCNHRCVRIISSIARKHGEIIRAL